MAPKNTKEVVMSYINALNSRDYDAAIKFLDKEVRIMGPAGERYGKPKEFIEMLNKFQGKYDVKKIFVDGNEVCLLYDYVLPGSTVYMSSWYKINEGVIGYIRTVFDPAAFSSVS